MKLVGVAGLCLISLGMFACAAEPGEGEGATESDLVSQLKENDALTCAGGAGPIALVGDKDHKPMLVTLTPAGKLFALSGDAGTLTTSATKWSWKTNGSALELDASLKGTLKKGSTSARVTCKKAPANEAASWAAAKALVVYAGEIDGLASTVTDEMSQTEDGSGDESNDASSNAAPNAYTVFAVETSKRDQLDLGTKADGSAGAIPGDDGEQLLDEDDWSYGGISAAYALGGGEDYAEWFQGASDGISLSGDVTPALGSAHGGFIAHEKVKALASVVDSAQPNAIELTVGGWTFLLPDAFSK